MADQIFISAGCLVQMLASPFRWQLNRLLKQIRGAIVTIRLHDAVVPSSMTWLLIVGTSEPASLNPRPPAASQPSVPESRDTAPIGHRVSTVMDFGQGVN